MPHVSYFVPGGGLFGLWLHCLAKGQWKDYLMSLITLEVVVIEYSLSMAEQAGNHVFNTLYEIRHI